MVANECQCQGVSVDYYVAILQSITMLNTRRPGDSLGRNKI